MLSMKTAKYTSLKNLYEYGNQISTCSVIFLLGYIFSPVNSNIRDIITQLYPLTF